MDNGTFNAAAMLKKNYPALSESQCSEILDLLSGAMTVDAGDKVSLVITAPPSFSIKARTTMNVVQSMITGAQKNILITGYSLSPYFSDLVDTIVQKSQSGVFVKFFVNNIEKQTGFDKLMRYKGISSRSTITIRMKTVTLICECSTRMFSWKTPESWKAFLRRIKKVIEFRKDGPPHRQLATATEYAFHKDPLGSTMRQMPKKSATKTLRS